MGNQNPINQTWNSLVNVIRRKEFIKRAWGYIWICVSVLIGFNELLTLVEANLPITLPLLAIFFAVAVPASACFAWPRNIQGSFTRNSYIEVTEGDLMDRAAKNTDLIVVGTSCSFDTNPRVVNHSSVQAQVTEKFFSPSAVDPLAIPTRGASTKSDYLRSQLKEALNEHTANARYKSKVGYEYPPGTVARIAGNNGTEFLFLAYTQSDGLHITCNPDTIWHALWGLWREADKLGANSKPISMPALGTLNAGMSDRLGVEGSIKLIIMSYAFAADLYPNGLPKVRIVLRPQDFDQLNRSDIQNFISTLAQVR